MRALWLALLALCGAALIAACGGDDDGSDAGAGETTGGAETVVVDSSNGDFNPATIYKKASTGVVTILSVFGGQVNPLTGEGGAGQGSGFVISEEGEILTNAHVVTTGGKAAGGGPIRKAEKVYVQFADRNQVPAEIVGIDPDADVALIKVDPDGLELVPLQLAEGGGIVVGQPVATIGSPFGEEQSLSIGVISATDRTIPSLTDFSIAGAIQTDASINPGNSGGPLINADSEVIGINQQIESQSGSNAGVGFAVPIEAVRYALEQLRESGEVEYAFIGVSTQTVFPQLAQKLGIDVDSGALIAEVTKNSPAEKAGLRGGDEETRFQAIPVTTGGDVIVAIDGKPVKSSDDVADLIANRRPGETLTFEVIRDGEHRDVEVTLAKRPEGVSG